MKQEKLGWLADSGRFTQRFEDEIGRQCQELSIKKVAENNRLSWEQVKRMEMTYMKRLVEANPISTNLRAIGVDEVSIRKGHTYKIIVADLDEQRPIWVGGAGRKKEDFDTFFREIGKTRADNIEIVVMDMWRPFRKSTIENIPQARIIYDKFHITKHLSKAIDELRREEYKRANKKDRKYIKGQRYTLLSHKANLKKAGRKSLKLLLKANRRLHKAYLLKETFGQLWDYSYPVAAIKFFDNWKAQLKWQRLKPLEKFTKTIEKHWDGIISYCHPNNKVSLGFMEGLNNKIRVIQRRAYGIKDQEYLRLKILTSFIKSPLPPRK